jgi:two-component system chemotaxis sensor kinase CheA
LQCLGEATEVERMVAEGLADPLMHMMRNALDHGIEPPSERFAAGKATMGVVTLRAECRAGRVELEIQDDGRGMDPARIRHAAVARGILAEDVVLSREETLALIFAPGFSLAEKVTAVSGRGVGMDVLKQNIDRLGGRIEITSQVGVGSTFRIILPGMVATSD